MKRGYFSSLATLGTVVLLYGPSPALAQGYLGANLRPYAVLGGTAVTCAGGSAITGDVGVSPAFVAAITGFPGLCSDVGVIQGSPAADPGQADLLIAYNTLAALPCAATIGPDLVGLTLTQGVYCVTAGATNLSGTLTLNAQGNANAVWVFKMASTLIASVGSTVSVINGGNPCAVEWQVSSDATINTGTTFVGNILALNAITMNGNLTGRALARNAAVTMTGATIGFGRCLAGGGATGVPPPFPAAGVPTLPGIGVGALLVVLLGSGAYLLGRRTPTEASR
jgi:hypothetical protein